MQDPGLIGAFFKKNRWGAAKTRLGNSIGGTVRDWKIFKERRKKENYLSMEQRAGIQDKNPGQQSPLFKLAFR
jgi:hypothetical protein